MASFELAVTMIIIAGIALCFGLFVVLSEKHGTIRFLFMMCALWLMFFGFMWAKSLIEQNLGVNHVYNTFFVIPLYAFFSINTFVLFWFLLDFFKNVVGMFVKAGTKGKGKEATNP